MESGNKTQEYITVEEAATELRLSRTNLYYYLGQMEIEPTKFQLDRKAYIRRSDLERVKVARGAAATSTRVASDDVLTFLAKLGLAVTPHSDPSHGWGYTWFGREWDGPYPTPVDAIRAAFQLVDKNAQLLRDMPSPTFPGELFWWDGEEWYTARHKEGELQIFTSHSQENEGYELVADVMTRRDAWLQPVPPTGNNQADEERERARLAALWLTAGLRELRYHVDPIDWQNDGLRADVIVGDSFIGDLLTVYNHFRDDNFLAWLKEKIHDIQREAQGQET